MLCQIIQILQQPWHKCDLPFSYLCFCVFVLLQQSFAILCPGWPQTQTHISPTSASQMLRLKVYTTMLVHLSFSRWANSSRLRGAKFWFQKTELRFKHGSIWVFGLSIYVDKVSLCSPSWSGSIYSIEQVEEPLWKVKEEQVGTAVAWPSLKFFIGNLRWK